MATFYYATPEGEMSDEVCVEDAGYLIDAGVLTEDTLCWADGMDDWVPLRNFWEQAAAQEERDPGVGAYAGKSGDTGAGSAGSSHSNRGGVGPRGGGGAATATALDPDETRAVGALTGGGCDLAIHLASGKRKHPRRFWLVPAGRGSIGHDGDGGGEPVMGEALTVFWAKKRTSKTNKSARLLSVLDTWVASEKVCTVLKEAQRPCALTLVLAEDDAAQAGRGAPMLLVAPDTATKQVWITGCQVLMQGGRAQRQSLVTTATTEAEEEAATAAAMAMARTAQDAEIAAAEKAALMAEQAALLALAKADAAHLAAASGHVRRDEAADKGAAGAEQQARWAPATRQIAAAAEAARQAEAEAQAARAVEQERLVAARHAQAETEAARAAEEQRLAAARQAQAEAEAARVVEEQRLAAARQAEAEVVAAELSSDESMTGEADTLHSATIAAVEGQERARVVNVAGTDVAPRYVHAAQVVAEEEVQYPQAAPRVASLTATEARQATQSWTDDVSSILQRALVRQARQEHVVAERRPAAASVSSLDDDRAAKLEKMAAIIAAVDLPPPITSAERWEQEAGRAYKKLLPTAMRHRQVRTFEWH
jgi:hypothetical protein